MPNKTRTILIVVVVAVWAVNFTAPIFVKGYTPPAEIHVVFMALISGLLAGYKKSGEGDSEDEEDRPPAKKPPAKKPPLKKPASKKAIKKVAGEWDQDVD